MQGEKREEDGAGYRDGGVVRAGGGGAGAGAGLGGGRGGGERALDRSRGGECARISSKGAGMTGEDRQRRWRYDTLRRWIGNGKG